MAARAITWVKEGQFGLEFADIELEPHRLTAHGVAIGVAPVVYRLDYKLETLDDFVTSLLLVTARGNGWSRRLHLSRLGSGGWRVRASEQGQVDLASAGGEAGGGLTGIGRQAVSARRPSP
jgi:hypothetical protein